VEEFDMREVEQDKQGIYIAYEFSIIIASRLFVSRG
jgi:hypothetical protein